MPYYKITNKEENHHGFQYEDGLNVLTDEFKEQGSCVAGGLYFTNEKYIFRFFNFGIYLREIFLPTDNPKFKMVQDPDADKWRANMIILGKRHKLANIETIKFLIDNGADIHFNNEYLLQWASSHGYLDIVQHLVQCEADIHICNEHALYLAAKNCYFDVAIFLIQKGANIHANNDDALMSACIYGCLDTVRFLVKSGADVHARNDEAIKLAYEYNHDDVIKFLIASGANRNNTGCCPIKY